MFGCFFGEVFWFFAGFLFGWFGFVYGVFFVWLVGGFVFLNKRVYLQTTQQGFLNKCLLKLTLKYHS